MASKGAESANGGAAGRAGAAFVSQSASVDLPTRSGMRRILSNVSFAVAPGGFLSIIGASGAGKTTLLRTLGGLIPCSDGSVLIDGVPIKGPPRGAVIVFQDYGRALLPWRTVERNVGLGIESDLSKDERRARVAEALATVGLTGAASDYPWQLSGGMQQRVQIARALALRPSVLLMDEPFGALDAMTKASLQDELLAVHKRTRATIVFITHDVEEAVYLSDQVAVLSGSPGSISEVLPVDLPRPRDQVETKQSPEYLELRHLAYDALRRE